jgi:hypothetical protein
MAVKITRSHESYGGNLLQIGAQQLNNYLSTWVIYMALTVSRQCIICNSTVTCRMGTRDEMTNSISDDWIY